MPTKELCFFIQQRNSIRSGLTNDVSVFLPFDLASRTGIGDARILSAANGIQSTKASPKQLNQCWPVEDEEAAKCTNDAKENIIKNHLSWRVWETSFYSLFSLFIPSFVWETQRMWICVRLWTSMIMKLMNTYRRFRFILHESAKDQSHNYLNCGDARETRRKTFLPCLRRTWPPNNAIRSISKQ